MASDLMSIGLSGAQAARAGLDISAQNIANVNTNGYVRRSLAQEELIAASNSDLAKAHTLAGARISGTNRNATDFLAAEVRRNTSDAQRSATLVDGLRPIQNGIENAGVFGAITDYEAALKRLSSDPTSAAQRASVIGAVGVMSSAFVFGAGQLSEHGSTLSLQAETGAAAVNQAAEELANINRSLAQARPGSAGHANLLDARDVQLGVIAEYAGIKTSFNSNGVATVTLSGDGAVLVDVTAVSPLSVVDEGDGTVSFAVDGTPAVVGSGKLAGISSAMESNRDALTELDALALRIADLVNTAQASGVDIDGVSGAPLLAATSAADMAVLTRNGDKIVTAAAGEPAGSRDISVLNDLRVAFDSGGVAETANSLIFDLSSRINAEETTSAALDAIAAFSISSHEASAGVDLDQEAANLIRYEQAFQASGRVMQIATELLDTILGIR